MAERAPAPAPDDGALVRRVLEGDTEAFGHLVRRHAHRTRAVAMRHLPPERVDDALQDAFLRAYQSLDGFTPGTDFAAWLCTLTVRACYDSWRAAYRRREVGAGDLDESHHAWAERVLAADAVDAFRAETERAEAREVLAHALAVLGAEERMVLTLVHLEGLTVREAAGQLGWSVANVKVRAHRARRRLRAVLEPLLHGSREES